MTGAVKTYIIPPQFLDRPRTLVFAQDSLEFEDRDLKGKEFTRMLKSDIVDFTHGVEHIVWYKFSVGRRFFINVKSRYGDEFKISFRDFFRYKEEKARLYQNIINDIWNYFHLDIVRGYLKNFDNIGAIEVKGLKLDSFGVHDEKKTIVWEQVCLQEFSSYFVVFDALDPKVNFRISYGEYGTEILWTALKSIMKSKEKDKVVQEPRQ